MADSAGVEVLLVRWEDETFEGLSPKSRHRLHGSVVRLAAWMAPGSVLDATTGDLTAWLQSLEVSARTRADRLGALHRFYNWALRNELVERDPAAPLSRIKQPLAVSSFTEIIRQWWVAQERKNLKRSTIESRCRQLRLLHDWIAPKSIVDASMADIEGYLDSRRFRGKPLGPRSRYTAISNYHEFFDWARKHGMVEKDPTDLIDRPRLPHQQPRPIRTDHLAEALEKATSEVAAILSLAAFCGLRAQEIAGISREDLLDHLAEPMLIVAAPKGHRERTVPLHPTAWESLQRMGLRRGGPVFMAPDGKRYQPWKVSHLANEHLHSLGISASLHQLRHWFATGVYGASLDLRLTQELCGHASPTTTAKYAQFNQGKATAVVAQLVAHS